MGEGLIQLTDEEVRTACMNIANPGVCPNQEELVDLIEQDKFSEPKVLLDIYKRLHTQQLQITGLFRNVNKIHRCPTLWPAQIIKKATITTMSPVQDHPQQNWERARNGAHTYGVPDANTLSRLQGLFFMSPELFTWYSSSIERMEPELPNLKVWYHTSSPCGAHYACMNNHHIMTTSIPMGETQFLRAKPMFAALPEEALAGIISVRCCNQVGSGLRVEIMDYMTDIEVPCLVNHYSVLTGPVIGGYFVVFTLRGEHFCRAVAMSFSLNERLVIYPRLFKH